jgi:hypothetical protein
MHSASRIAPQLPRRWPNLQRRQRTALSPAGDRAPFWVTPRPANGPETSTYPNRVAPPDSHPTHKVARHLPKAQPLSPNASKAKDKARSTGSFNPR